MLQRQGRRRVKLFVPLEAPLWGNAELQVRCIAGKGFLRGRTPFCSSVSPRREVVRRAALSVVLRKWGTAEGRSQNAAGMRGMEKSGEAVALPRFRCSTFLWRNGKIPLFFLKAHGCKCLFMVGISIAMYTQTRCIHPREHVEWE